MWPDWEREEGIGGLSPTEGRTMLGVLSVVGFKMWNQLVSEPPDGLASFGSLDGAPGRMYLQLVFPRLSTVSNRSPPMVRSGGKRHAQSEIFHCKEEEHATCPVRVRLVVDCGA